MELRIRHLDGVRFEAQTRGHRIITDLPVDLGGTDSGMMPPELLLASLGTCAGVYAAQYLRKHHLRIEDLEVSITADKVPGPARLDAFRIHVTAPGLAPEHEAGLLRSVDFCLIKNTLAAMPSIQTVLHTAQHAHV